MNMIIMKKVMILIVAGGCVGCSVHKDLEVVFTNAELVKIDTLYRYPDRIKQLTWKDENNTEFISMVKMQDQYNVGLRMRVLRQR
jgi:hypothetical protein